MILQELQVWIVGMVVSGITMLFLFIIFMATRYRKFKTNQFVIHLRNGKVKHMGIGGSLWLLPLIDEYIVIPLSHVQTSINAHIQVVSKDHDYLSISGSLIWRVIDAEKAFSSASWCVNDSNYIEKVLESATEAIIRTVCVNISFEKIILERRRIIREIKKEICKLTSSWGIFIESMEIQEVNVLEPSLKNKYDFNDLPVFNTI